MCVCSEKRRENLEELDVFLLLPSSVKNFGLEFVVMPAVGLFLFSSILFIAHFALLISV